MARVLVIGLDCVPPILAFDAFRTVMPHLDELMAKGAWGPLRSTVPPITVPAWTSMVSGRDPGELGLYGFRNRVGGTYDLRIADGRDVAHKRVWDWIGEAGFRVAPLFVPLTYPPPPVRGQSIACFLTPDHSDPWAFPAPLRAELTERFGPYRMDIPDFRGTDPLAVIEGARHMGEQHFAMAEYVWKEKKPDFMMMVEMGPDRVHHAAWRSVARTFLGEGGAPRDKDRAVAQAVKTYYADLDRQVGHLRSIAGPDTNVLIVSDHGARTMQGGVRINRWLMDRGWLTLRPSDGDDSSKGNVVPRRADRPQNGTGTQSSTERRVTPDTIDWARTRAWGEGGYYGRVFLNVRGREPEGIVPPEEVAGLEREIAAGLEDLALPETPSPTRVLFPRRTFRRCQGTAPDLMVFFGDLAWRSLGTVTTEGGPAGWFSATNDGGDDGANHDWNGIFVAEGPDVTARGKLEGLEIYDVASTVLGLMGVEPPPDLLGRDRSKG
ncbi:MAG: alkaline phosphatase family protein [Myxococcales bacterium]|nr:alkaline phosphatase family protein [Myxococcales bacterium]